MGERDPILTQRADELGQALAPDLDRKRSEILATEDSGVEKLRERNRRSRPSCPRVQP
jgi:hypothetical protein